MDGRPYAIIGEVKPTYLWGVGSQPLLPPMTELAIYDQSGRAIVTSDNVPKGNAHDIPRKSISKSLRLFRYSYNGRIYFAAASELFIKSRFQNGAWNIVLSQTQKSMMLSLENFKRTFPFVILLFLLLILYLSMVFIKKGLKPLEKLKEGTRRVADQDFSTTVDIQSDDEFEELGNAFNQMSVKLQKQFHALTVRGEIDRAILSSFKRHKVLATALSRLKEFFACDISLYVKNADIATEYIKVYIMGGRRADDPRVEYHTLELAEKDLLFSEIEYKVLRDTGIPKFLHAMKGGAAAEYLCLPISLEGKIQRSLLLGWNTPHVFTEDEFEQARQIANQLAVALANSKLLEDLEKLAMGTIEALARTVDAKSKWTAGHSERVAELSARIGKAMGFSAKEVDTLTTAALLHDIGKIGIPLAILDKPGKLDDTEYAEIKNHPAIGAEILEPIKVFEDILPVVAQHHEQYAGGGYPLGLQGEEIDPRARIMAVADVWDALVSERPYRSGWIADRAKKLIIEKSGSHFDPRVVEVFLAVVGEI